MTDFPDAFLNRDTAELLPTGGRHVRVECQAPGEPPSVVEAGYNTETLANAVGDLARTLLVGRSAAGHNDVVIVFLDERGAALGSLTVDAGFLLRQGRWPGQPAVRHANALAAMLAGYCTIGAYDLLVVLEEAAADPAYRRELSLADAELPPEPATAARQPHAFARPALRGRAG